MAIDRTAMRIAGAYEGGQRAKLPIYDSGSESGNLVLTMEHPMRELFLVNDSMSDNLTLNVAGDASLSLDFVLIPNEQFDERLPEFLTVTVVSPGAWHWRVRSGRVT
jgi:hypothetical protein